MLTIGEVARRSGVAATTLRYYEQIGLLPAPIRLGGQRRYDEAVLSRLEVIALCKTAGFALDEIQRLLAARWPGPNSPRSTPSWSRWPGPAPSSSGGCGALARRSTPAPAAFTQPGPHPSARTYAQPEGSDPGQGERK